MKSQQSIPTLQDVLDKIERLEEGTKKRDLKSAVVTFCRVLGRSPGDVLAVPHELRGLRESVAPLAAGLTERRWANVCSGLTKAIELVRELVPSRNTTPLLPEWKVLLDTLPNKLVRKLSAGMRHLSGKGVKPATVTAADLQEYCEAIVADRMRRKAEKAADAFIWAWNRTAKAFPAWPQVTMPRKDKRDSFTYPLDYFPPSFAADVEAYIGRLTQGILFGDDDDDDDIDLGPLRPVRPATAQTRRRQLRAAASCLAHSGVPASEIRSIATLVEVRNARLILNFLMQRQDGQPTRKGATFGIGALHVILTNRCYATGKWPYGVRNSRTGERHDPASIVEIEVPTILPLDLFEQVQARLARNNPKVTPPRVVNGPTLLTGLATCATCGFGMTRSGTTRRGRRYSYYSCAGCKLKGKSVCKGRHVSMEKLDSLVIEGVADKLLVPNRMEEILSAMIDRAAAKDSAVAERRHQLETELAAVRTKLSRLYSAIEEGVIDLDEDLKDRIATLKTKRDIVQASLEQISSQVSARATITPTKISAFTELMRNKLTNGDIRARKEWLGSVLDRIEVDDHAVKIIGNKQVLAAAMQSQNAAVPQVRGFVRKWRTRQDSNL